MEAGVPPGGGTGVLDRQDEAYGGTVINLVLEFEGVFTVDKKHSELGNALKMDFDMGGNMTMPMYLNEGLIETFLKPLIAMKYFRLHWLSPWASQINAHLEKAEGIKPLEIIPPVDPAFYMEYMDTAKEEGVDASEHMPAVYKAFEFDHRPLAWVGNDLKLDAYKWSMFVRGNTTVHSVAQPAMGLSSDECQQIFSDLQRYLG